MITRNLAMSAVTSESALPGNEHRPWPDLTEHEFSTNPLLPGSKFLFFLQSILTRKYLRNDASK